MSSDGSSEFTLQYKPKISRRQARNLIAAFAMFGDYPHGPSSVPRPTSMRETAIALFKLGVDPDRLAEQCRDYNVHVPYFENLLTSTWRTVGSPKVSLVDRTTGHESGAIEGPGIVTTSVYESRLGAACAARDRAVEYDSFEEFQGAIAKGIAALEAFIADRANEWNAQNPSQKLRDSKQDKVSLDDKLDEWVPLMSGGQRIDKGDQRWAHFKILRGIRDTKEIHPKGGGQLVTLEELADQINMFRLGIAGMLAQLHVIFRVTAPRAQIRALYQPDVEVVPVASSSAV